MSAIKEISGKIIKDSRNEDTVEAHIRLESGALGVASVPSGKSKGIREAATISPDKSVELIHNEIAEDLRGKSFMSLKDFANELGDVPHGSLRLFANMIEGGLHAENNLRFQEHWAIPEAISFKNQVELTKIFFKELGDELTKRFPDQKITFSDEGSYSLHFENESQPFETMDELRNKLGLVGSLDFGMDAAASDVKGEPLELIEIYKDWRRRFGLISIEDPFSEEDFIDFKKLEKELPGVFIIGDD